MSEQNIRFTIRDLGIIDFLFKVNFATLEQIAKHIRTDKLQSLYVRLNQLTKVDYIKSSKIFYDEPLVFSVGRKAKEVTNTELSVAKVIPNNFKHNLSVVDLYLYLFTCDGILRITTEAELIKQKLSNREIGKARPSDENFYSIPDLVINDGKLTAFEVELSKKSDKRLAEKIQFYARNRDYYQVYYLCGSSGIRDRVIEEVSKQKLTHIKAMLYEEYLGGTR